MKKNTPKSFRMGLTYLPNPCLNPASKLVFLQVKDLTTLALAPQYFGPCILCRLFRSCATELFLQLLPFLIPLTSSCTVLTRKLEIYFKITCAQFLFYIKCFNLLLKTQPFAEMVERAPEQGFCGQIHALLQIRLNLTLSNILLIVKYCQLISSRSVGESSVQTLGKATIRRYLKGSRLLSQNSYSTFLEDTFFGSSSQHELVRGTSLVNYVLL